MESILTSVKKFIGIFEDDETFDIDVIMCINSELAILVQMGVGPKDGFSIKDKTSLWTDFLGNGKKLEFVKDAVKLKAKLIFDPPLSSSTVELYKESIKENEWRAFIEEDPILNI